MNHQHCQRRMALCLGLITVLLAGCAGTSIQYPLFPDQAKRVEDPAKARIYFMWPSGAIKQGGTFAFYGTGPAATGPRIDPRQAQPTVPLFGLYPQNPSPDSPFRIIGEVAAGTYICWEEPPRVLNLQSVGPIDLLAGQVYFLRLKTGAFTGVKMDVIQNEDEARAILKKCRPPHDYGGEK